jgi:hypothetical protein
MWTDKNAKDVARLLKSFKPNNRFIVPEFGKHAEDKGKGKLFAKLQRSMVPKLAGWHALQMAAQQHVCLACKDKILPSASAVCSECLTTPKGKRVSGEVISSRTQAACLEKYGVPNAMHADTIKRKHQKALATVFSGESREQILRKRRKTNLKKYGVEWSVKSDSVRAKLSASTKESWEHKEDRLAKTRSTSKATYGTDYPTQSESVKAKHRTTLQDRYGHPNAAWGRGAQAKVRATHRRRFGVDYAMQSKAVRKKAERTMLDRYGVQTCMHSRDIRLKVIRGAQRLTEVTVQGKTFECQGYERFVLPRLAKRFGVHNVLGQFDSKFESLHFGKRVYTPDFYVKSNDTYVEVKSTFTLIGKLGTSDFLKDNRRLQRLANAQGVKLKFIVYHPKSDSCIVLDSDWPSLSKAKLTQLITN